MANDPSLELRQAIIQTLRADAGLTALVPATRVYGERTPANPTFPFTRYGVSDARPRRAQCWDGAEIDVAIHTFSKAESTDEAAGLNAAISAALDHKVIELSGGLKADLAWTGAMIIADPAEADSFHGINRFTATIR